MSNPFRFQKNMRATSQAGHAISEITSGQASRMRHQVSGGVRLKKCMPKGTAAGTGPVWSRFILGRARINGGEGGITFQ